MDIKEIQSLVEKFIENSASSDEEEALMLWYRSANEQELEWLSEYADERELIRLQMLAEINRKIGHLPVRWLGWRWLAAASILLVISVGGYFIAHKFSSSNITIVNNDVAPGGNQAVLHLANGKMITLTDAKNGTLANQNNTAINKTSAGQIVYNTLNRSDKDAKTVYDTLTTPRGGIWHIALADGSVVWLNAATSIRYPENFTGKERVVELIGGEAYFEVNHNAAKPFKVSVAGQMVEDIGTHFNINAYKDEPHTRTTLLEGSVKVVKGNESTTLKPGQEAILKNNHFIITEADVDHAIAWKNGLISFDNTDIKSLMRQLSRWYNIQVEYQGAVTNHEFAGDIRRNTNLSDVLKIMEQGGIHFKIDGRKITVTE